MLYSVTEVVVVVCHMRWVTDCCGSGGVVTSSNGGAGTGGGAGVSSAVVLVELAVAGVLSAVVVSLSSSFDGGSR